MESQSFNLAKEYLGREVSLKIDRPLGSRHPQHDFKYEVNYGYVPGTIAPDGWELDAYYLGVDKPVKEAEGVCIAVVHRLDDDDDKLVVTPFSKKEITDKEIEKFVHFQEKWFKHEIVRGKDL